MNRSITAQNFILKLLQTENICYVVNKCKPSDDNYVSPNPSIDLTEIHLRLFSIPNDLNESIRLLIKLFIHTIIGIVL